MRLRGAWRSHRSRESTMRSLNIRGQRSGSGRSEGTALGWAKRSTHEAKDNEQGEVEDAEHDETGGASVVGDLAAEKTIN